MNPEDIKQAFIQTMRPVMIARGLAPELPNITAPAGRAGLVEFGRTGSERYDPTLKGGAVEERGTFVATVKCAKGDGEDEGNGHAFALSLLFPKGRVLTFADDWLTYFTFLQVEIRQPCTIRPGYPDATHWRIPLLIPYEAKAKNPYVPKIGGE